MYGSFSLHAYDTIVARKAVERIEKSESMALDGNDDLESTCLVSHIFFSVSMFDLIRSRNIALATCRLLTPLTSEMYIILRRERESEDLNLEQNLKATCLVTEYTRHYDVRCKCACHPQR